MRLSSCLTCGIKPLWDALYPRYVQRRADREAAAAEVAVACEAAYDVPLDRARAAIQADNHAKLVARSAQTSWRSSLPSPPQQQPQLQSRQQQSQLQSPPQQQQPQLQLQQQQSQLQSPPQQQPQLQFPPPQPVMVRFEVSRPLPGASSARP